ncbi:MAG: hypothetical protein OXB84_07295 [Halobacteriovoraceae bacterium]|nr:hypothetical protein [Halobacteriovoraceae bacterium]
MPSINKPSYPAARKKSSAGKESRLSIDKKYALYEDSVQNHLGDIEFVNDEYQKIHHRQPLYLREDFCGTAAMACSWVRQSEKHQAWGIDLDKEPINYGIQNHYAKLDNPEKNRMQYIKGNVMDNHHFKADVVVAFNFSYQIFKKRRDMLAYFRHVKKGLTSQGIFFIDIFGGTETRQELEEKTKHDNHTYYWDCDQYNPITHEALYYIHFRTRGVKYKKVFKYDWRLWTMAELKEIMEDAGFSKVLTYWEGEDKDGEGDGNFYLSEKEDNCESWVTYICGIP